MKKVRKIIFLVFIILIGVIVLDTLQAKVFDNRPLIKITEDYNGLNVLKRDKGIFVYTYIFLNGEKVTVYRWTKYEPPLELQTSNTTNNNQGKEEDRMEKVNVIIKNQKYSATIEENETTKEFLSLLPQEFAMKELNGNEKYVYMDKSLPPHSISPKHIKRGDIMLYGNNCLVLFYQSFDTEYRYTKIGHIDHLPDLGEKDVIVRIEE